MFTGTHTRVCVNALLVIVSDSVFLHLLFTSCAHVFVVAVIMEQLMRGLGQGGLGGMQVYMVPFCRETY